MAHINRFNAVSKIAGTRNNIAWSKNASALLFAAILIVCSVTVGCSSDKPKPVSSNIPIAQTPSPIATATQPAPAVEPMKPAPKKVAKKRPATVTYTDKTYGVTFAYPRRYALETGNAATELISSGPVPMNFVQPGGVALAAVELPQTGFANTDFSSAFFNVSVNNALTAEQCGEFSVPAPKAADTSDGSTQSGSTQAQSTGSKLMLGDMEMQGTEAVAGEGTRQSDSKYFHVFQHGACYEFALNVTTIAPDVRGSVQGGRHVDRDKVFNRLEQILATVKINPVEAAPAAAPESTASTIATPSAPAALASDATASTPAPPAAPAVSATPAATATSPQ